MSCSACELSKKCNSSGIMGDKLKTSSHNPRIMIVQDHPTFRDDQKDMAPSGDTEAKLNYFLRKAGIDKRDVFFTSGIKCSVKKAGDIKNKHINECRNHILGEIKAIKPKIIIPMGKTANWIISDKKSIQEFAGHFDEFEMDYPVINKVTREKRVATFKAKVLPTYGLNASMNKWEYNSEIIRHLGKALKYVKTGEIQRTPDPRLNVILTLKGLREFKSRALQAKWGTTDFETTGFEFFKDKLINGGYCFDGQQVDVLYFNKYLPEHIKSFDKTNTERAKQINDFIDKYRDEIFETARIVHDNVQFVLHNGKFDSKFAAFNKIPYRYFKADTLIGDSLIDENMGHSLNVVYERNGINFGAYDTDLWPYTNKDEKKRKSYQWVPPFLIEKYLGYDVYGLYHIWVIQEAELIKQNLMGHFVNRKMPALKMVTHSEYIGMKADRKLILSVGKAIVSKQEETLVQLKKLTRDAEFNPNSGKQISDYMIKQKYPLEKLDFPETNTGYSTAGEHLEKLLKYKKYAVFPKLVMDFKKLTKIRGTYVDGTKKGQIGGMLQYLDMNNMIHTNFNLWTPRTSRWSANRPSVQVWPRPITGLPNARNFIIPRRGWNLFEADYVALEMAVVAGLAKERVLTKLINDGTDIHSYNATSLGKTLGQVEEHITYEMFLQKIGKSKSKDAPTKEQIEADPELKKIYLIFNELRTQIKCLNGSTRIPTEFGLIKIKDLVADKLDDNHWFQKLGVKVSTGGKAEIAETIHHKWNTSEYKIFAKHGQVFANMEHPFFVWRDCRIQQIRAEDLKTGDYLIKPRTEKLFAKEEVKLQWSPISQVSNPRNTSKSNTWLKSGASVSLKSLPETLNEDLAFLLGFIIAEGAESVYSFVQKESEEVVGKVRQIFESQFGVPFQETKTKDGTIVFHIPAAVKHSLIENDILKSNSAEVRVPEAIFRSPKNVVRKFLQGYFEGDGSKNKAVSKSYGLILDLMLLLDNFNIFAKYSESWNRADKKKKLKLYHQLEFESYEYSKFSQEIGFFSERKNAKLKRSFIIDSRKVYGLEAQINKIKEKYTRSTRTVINGKRVALGERVHSQEDLEVTYRRLLTNSKTMEAIKAFSEFENNSLHRDLKYLIDNDCQLSEIKKIEKVEGKFKHYDLTIAHEDHNFIANGFLTHNSVGFGLNYGKGANSFAEEFGIDVEQAQEMIDAYFALYKDMKKWRDNIVRMALTRGVIKLPSGRKRRFTAAIDWINSKEGKDTWNAKKLKEEIARQAMNYPVQGGAHEVFEPACIRVTRRFKKEGLKARIGFYIHDGILGECPVEENARVYTILKEEMPFIFNKGTDLELKLNIDVDFYESCWYSAKKHENYDAA